MKNNEQIIDVTENNQTTGDLSNNIKTYTQDEVDMLLFEERKNIQSQIDSRVSQALNTREQKYKEEKLTIEEQVEALQSELNSMRSNYNISNNTNEAVKKFSEAGIPLDLCQPLLNSLIDEDLNLTMQRTDNLLTVINTLKTTYKDEFTKKMTNVPSPTKSNSKTTITKAEFDKMDIGQKIEFANKYPNIADEFMNL